MMMNILNLSLFQDQGLFIIPFIQQGMQALLDLIHALDGSVSETAKLLGFVAYGSLF